jgi:hypothetical protein
VWRVNFFLKLTRSAPYSPCATGKFSNFENFAADSKMFENFPAYSNFIFFKKFSPFQRCGTHHVCMAHIEYASLIGGLSVAHIEYAPLIGGLSMAHIVYAPRIALTEVRLVGPTYYQ